MFSRAVTYPFAPASVWRALTEPAALVEWFGGGVELDLRPGGQARFGPTDDDGGRNGVVTAVEEDRHLRFRWWPEDDADDVSEVSYDLEPDDEGTTTLTVTERRLPATTDAVVPEMRTPADETGLSACVPAGAGWTTHDQRGFELWASAARPSVGAGR